MAIARRAGNSAARTAYGVIAVADGCEGFDLA
jgi:hypothetical protein